jgi:hypothetical protein
MSKVKGKKRVAAAAAAFLVISVGKRGLKMGASQEAGEGGGGGRDGGQPGSW